jgi:lactoylglutathione lyase
VLGIQQVAIGARDKAPLVELWTELLGVPLVGKFRSAAENVDEDIARVGVEPFAVELDLMQPIDPDARPRVHEPALNHVGLWVDDLRSAVDWLSERGVRFAPGGIRPGAAGHDICFIHPKPSPDQPIAGCGVLIELVQAPPDLIARYHRG